MKRSKLLIVLAHILCLFQPLKAQFIGVCGSTDQARPSSSPPAGPCDLFLNDFKPMANDATIEVGVKVWIFAPTTNSNLGVWTYSTSAGDNITTIGHCTAAIQAANAKLAALSPTPKLTGNWNNNPYPSNLSDAKFKLKLVGYQIILDDYYYNHPSKAINTYDDDDAINFYLGACDENTTAINNTTVTTYDCRIYSAPPEGLPGIYPLNFSVFHAQTGVFWHPGWDNFNWYGETIAHEVGHVLGLAHTDANTTIYPPDYCCSGGITANDFYKEGLAITGPHGCTDPQGGNNLMSQDQGCYDYLSPMQMGVMHYNLRTSLVGLLTAQGRTDALSRDPAYDYTVSTSAWWGNSSRYMKGNLTIKSGVTLTVSCLVAMTKGAKVIVEPGAELIITSNGKITNISGELWDGIQVAGAAGQPQTMYNSSAYYNAPGQAIYQGVVRIMQGEVSNALNGISTYTTGSSGIDYGSTGGVVICYNADFINNVRDVVFMPYSNNQGSNISKFISCNFVTSNTLNLLAWPDVHAYLYKVKGIQFKGCNFENAIATPLYWQYSAPSGYNAGTGIYSQDATYSADRVYDINQSAYVKTKFNQLNCGVKAINSNPLYAPAIKNCDFTDNVSDGAYFKNVNNLVFENNLVQTPYIYAGTGIYLNNCAGYSIKNNQIKENTTHNYKTGTGIYAYNSHTGAHQIYNNSFANLEQGISAMGDNSGYSNNLDGLKMNCNDFTPVGNKYDIAMLNTTSQVKIANYIYTFPLYATVMKTQGSAINIPYSLVRNRYGASSTCSLCENMWYIDGTSYKAINHSSNSTSNSNTHPVPQPQYSDVGVGDVPTNTSYQPSHCSSGPGVNGGIGTSGPKNEEINTYLSALRAAHDPETNDLSYDIQAALSEKIAWFAADSSGSSADTVIATIENNSSFITNADVMQVYAYMSMGDYTTASSLANALGEGRSNWKNLLLTQISLDQSSGCAYSLGGNSGATAILQGLADNDTLDGHGAAESLLEWGLGQSFSEPRLHPAGEYGERMAHTESPEYKNKEQQEELIRQYTQVYPNPSQTGFTIAMPMQSGQNVKMELRDLPGRLIYINFIGSTGQKFVPMSEINNGVYILTLKNESGRVIYETKIVKQE